MIPEVVEGQVPGVGTGSQGGNHMDLIKIGKYIAGKRKNQGMTQKQLAEKLGMSDKSVSKWERGVCLPDVSVYSDLCLILVYCCINLKAIILF